MKKMLTVSLLGFFLLSLASNPGFSQDAKSVLNKVIDAVGGRAILESIKDTTLSGSIEIIQMGVGGTITFYHKEPNMLRQDMDIEGMVFSSASDGETAWMINPQTGVVEDLVGGPGSELDYQALNFGFAWLLHPDKYGLAYEVEGKDTIDGREYLILLQTGAGGRTTTFYIDPESYLTFKTITMVTNPMGFEVEQETIMEDYEKVDGVMLSHSIIIYQDGEEFGSMIVEEAKFNSGLEDSLFKK